jgi:hypothetical protein
LVYGEKVVVKLKILVNLLEGISPKNIKSLFELKHDDEYFIIEEMGNKGFKPIALTTWKIPLNKLRSTLITTEQEFLEKNKSVVGRGIVGGLLLGPAGLILGGLSGVGKKQKSKINYLYMISYTSAENEVKYITFTMPVITVNAVRKFDDSLKKLFELATDGTNEYYL